MIQRRAYEEVTIVHGDHAVTLRPTLRAATILEQRFGIPALFRALDELNVTIISEIILTTGYRQDAAAFLSSHRGRPLSSFFSVVLGPVAELVSMLTPAPDPMAKHKPAGKPITWAALFATLFDRATGWLGWTQEQAWNATATEISRAYEAHLEKLKAIHGGGEETTPHVDTDALAELLGSDSLDPEFDREGLHALKGGA